MRGLVIRSGTKVTAEVIEAAAIDTPEKVDAFERRSLEELGLEIDLVPPRYRSTYFNHIFSSPSGYSAGYYSYLWTEMLDRDSPLGQAQAAAHLRIARRAGHNGYRQLDLAPIQRSAVAQEMIGKRLQGWLEANYRPAHPQTEAEASEAP